MMEGIQKIPEVPEQMRSSHELTEEKRNLIHEILAGTHDYMNDDTPANYDALFRDDQEPYFLNIWNKENNKGLGYIVFHDFLIHIGVGSTFTSTDFTPGGKKLFQKAVDEGLIEQISSPQGFANQSRWKVLKDPKTNLQVLLGMLQ